MRLGFLELPADERRLYIEQAAVRRSVSPVVLEKDFWVCWLLGVRARFRRILAGDRGHSLPSPGPPASLSLLPRKGPK